MICSVSRSMSAALLAGLSNSDPGRLFRHNSIQTLGPVRHERSLRTQPSGGLHRSDAETRRQRRRRLGVVHPWHRAHHAEVDTPAEAGGYGGADDHGGADGPAQRRPPRPHPSFWMGAQLAGGSTWMRIYRSCPVMWATE